MGAEFKQPDQVTEREINRIHNLVDRVEINQDRFWNYIGNYMYFGLTRLNQDDFILNLYNQQFTESSEDLSKVRFFSLHFTPQTTHKKDESHRNPWINWMMNQDESVNYYCITNTDITTKQKSALSRFYGCLGTLKLIQLARQYSLETNAVMTTIITNDRAGNFFKNLGFSEYIWSVEYAGEVSTKPVQYIIHSEENLQHVESTTTEFLARLLRKYPFLLRLNPTISDLSKAN
ncbi:MAG: hypothetical protein OHK0017_11320 [Patescibacteria group bacterium]